MQGFRLRGPPGDELILLLSDFRLEKAKTLCQKLAEQVASETFTFDSTTYRVGISIGNTSITSR